MAVERYLVVPDDDWRIPLYARDMLWVTLGGWAAQAEGEQGRFVMDSLPEDGLLTLCWGRPDGPPLARWSLDELSGLEAVGWGGEVAIGGFVERLHTLTVRGLDLMIAEVEGGPLPASYTQLPDLDTMRETVFRRDDDAPLDDDRHMYPVIVQAETMLAESLHHALISELPMDCWGILGPQAGGWHDLVGLPILLEAVTLLAPRRR